MLFKIRTGFQKWIFRYISECSGHQEKGNHSQRLRKITNKTFDMMQTVKAEEFDGENANWENDNYHHEGNQ